MQAGYRPVEKTSECDYVLYTEIAEVKQQAGAVAKVSRFTGGIGLDYNKEAYATFAYDKINADPSQFDAIARKESDEQSRRWKLL